MAKRFTRKIFWNGFNILVRELKPHKKVVLTLVGMGAIAAVFEAFVPLLAGKIIDAIITIASDPRTSLTAILGLILAWFLSRVIHEVIGWRTDLKNQWLSSILEANYIAQGFGKLFEMPIRFHKEQKHGELGERITRAGDWLGRLVERVSVNLLPSFLTIIIALIIGFSINVTLTFILIGALTLYAAILWQFAPGLAALQVRTQLAYQIAYGKVYDALGNIQEIKQAATERYEQQDIRRKFVDRAMPLYLETRRMFQRLDFLQRMLIIISQLTIFVLSVFYVRNGVLTPGELVAFNGYTAMVFGPFVILGRNWQVVQNGFVALTRAEQVLNKKIELYKPKGGVSPERLVGKVSFENVSFSYETTGEVLKDISFTARSGDRIALVGESGVGKSTLIGLLLALYFPKKGKIIIDGTDIRRFDLIAYRSRVGVVSQEPTLFNDTILKNIKYGTFGASEKDVIAAAKLAHAHEFIEKFPKGYNSRVGWKGIKLSVGQKQRVALARAFLKNPDILILDEPTSALDARSEQFIKESLKKLMKGRTTFIIAHRLSTVREADIILVLKDGRIAERGSHHELMRKEGIYCDIYRLQTEFH